MSKSARPRRVARAGANTGNALQRSTNRFPVVVPALGLGVCLVFGVACGWLPGEADGPDEPALVESDGSKPAADLRAESIRQTIRSLEDECQRFGGGDWDQWCANLGPYRAALRARIGSARPHFIPHEGAPDIHWTALATERGEPPLLELGPASYLRYLTEPETVEPFRRTLPVAAVARWLRGQGIDLLFIPVPKMTEVYPDRMALPCPPDRVVAPHVRRVLLELLHHDVEVLDLLPNFLAAAERDERPLYYPDDTHWAPRGKERAASLIANRLARYTFLRCLREQPPRFKVTARPWTPEAENGRTAARLTAEQERFVEPALPRVVPEVSALGKDEVLDPGSPVLFIGDSYNEGLVALVAAELNVPVAKATSGGQTTEAINEAVRNPAMLRGCRVVVWVICNTSLGTSDAGRWQLPPRETLGAGAAAPQADESRTPSQP